MKEITFIKTDSPFGKIKGTLRIIGKILYYKFNENQYSTQIIEQLKQKGAMITRAKGWIRIDMFIDKDKVKLNDKEFNINETPEEEIENILTEFYQNKYKTSGFQVEIKWKNKNIPSGN